MCWFLNVFGCDFWQVHDFMCYTLKRNARVSMYREHGMIYRIYRKCSITLKLKYNIWILGTISIYFSFIRIKYIKMMYNIVLLHSRHNIYTEKSDYAKVSAIPHDTLRITTDMPVILYVITTRCLSFGICQNSHQHSVTILNRIWCFMIEFIIGYKKPKSLFWVVI